MKSALATLILRVPPSLHRRLKQEARCADTSLNKHCLALLSSRAAGPPAQGSPLALSFAAGASALSAALKNLPGMVLESVGNELEGLVLFGSIARGRQTESSDIDLLVVLREGVLLDRDVYSRWQFGRVAGREVAPLFVQIPAEGERIGGLWFEVALDGVVLFDRELRVTRFLCRVRDLVASGRIKRLITHGHPYWVRSAQVTHDLSSEGGL